MPTETVCKQNWQAGAGERKGIGSKNWWFAPNTSLVNLDCASTGHMSSQSCRVNNCSAGKAQRMLGLDLRCFLYWIWENSLGEWLAKDDCDVLIHETNEASNYFNSTAAFLLQFFFGFWLQDCSKSHQFVLDLDLPPTQLSHALDARLPRLKILLQGCCSVGHQVQHRRDLCSLRSWPRNLTKPDHTRRRFQE